MTLCYTHGTFAKGLAAQAQYIAAADREQLSGAPSAELDGWYGVLGRRRVVSQACMFGGRCRIRTCDFHRVKVALYR